MTSADFDQDQIVAWAELAAPHVRLCPVCRGSITFVRENGEPEATLRIRGSEMCTAGRLTLVALPPGFSERAQ